MECQRLSSSGLLEVMEGGLCGVVSPASRRPCSAPTPCTQQQSGPYIEEDTTGFSQIAPQKKVQLNVGGEAMVVKGTTVQVRCPVRGFDRRKVEWLYSGDVLPRKGRVKVSRGGMLRVRRSRAGDAGVYTCRAGGYSANITLDFYSTQQAYRMTQLRRQLIIANHQFIKRLRKGSVGGGKGRRGRSRDHYSLAYMLRVMNSTEIPFYYVPGEWSGCSRSCGGAGLQSREIACEVVVDYYVLAVDNHWCSDNGLLRPIDTRDCGFEKCPMWNLGHWQPVRLLHTHKLVIYSNTESILNWVSNR